MSQFSYASALRCIGQDLDRRGIKSFDIRYEAKEFVATGGYQEPPAPTPVTIHYSPGDLDDIDRAYAERRDNAGPGKEFLNIVQILRSVGGYLDRLEARLIRLTNNELPAGEPAVKVEYITREGEQVCADRAGSELYDMCVAMYKQRGKLTGTGGYFSRWRR